MIIKQQNTKGEIIKACPTGVSILIQNELTLLQ